MTEVNSTNEGGTLWVFGLKTERHRTLVDATAGARTEILGAWIYNTVNTAPAEFMFSARDSDLSIAGAT